MAGFLIEKDVFVRMSSSIFSLLTEEVEFFLPPESTALRKLKNAVFIQAHVISFNDLSSQEINDLIYSLQIVASNYRNGLAKVESVPPQNRIIISEKFFELLNQAVHFERKTHNL